MTDQLDIFLIVAPGLENLLADEAREKGFAVGKVETGGVNLRGDWPEVWRANLELRGATRVLVRVGVFHAVHLAQLDKRARRVPWAELIDRRHTVRVDATCRKSKIYHEKAATQRVETAIREEAGASIETEADIRVMVRIEHDQCTISLDTSGELLHRRGHKAAVNRAPMRETLASLFLRDCGYTGSEAVLDPMCGSGTFVIEAAEIALGLKPGRSRDFAFQHLKTFDAKRWAKMREEADTHSSDLRFFGSDRDPGAIRMSGENAERSGVAPLCAFSHVSVRDLQPPDCDPGLIIINPPYGGRIGDRKKLNAVYSSIGHALRSRFSGWRVGIVTSSAQLAKATGLPLGKPGPVVDHGGTKIRLYQTPALR
ncbi:MAG: THUMP domain-containing protein [Pseudomonadota bacterium]|nr:THUMP domain-containing protein [Pseudomonadota bacterium]